jgi:glycosyltransferase involved in cell wall biosynthesis
MLAIVTPIKNELDNLPALIEAVEKQTQPPSLWVIVDDQSTDGSSEFLREAVQRISNVDKVLLSKTENLPDDYQLGAKYARVVAAGFEVIRNEEQAQGISYDYIGILDADCFISAEYYKRILNKFSLLPKLGIASGVLYYDINGKKVRSRAPLRWPRGGIRVWRARCLEMSGYFITKSADAVSSASAWLNGWHNQAFMDATAVTREEGIRSDTGYYGVSSYERFVPKYYALMKCAWIALRGNPAFARNYYRGYMEASRQGKRGEINDRLKTYFRFLPFFYIRESLIVLRNQINLAMHNFFS